MGQLIVVDWDPTWANTAAVVTAELGSALPVGSWQQVEHIGSTSVPGLAAKPVIDLMAAAVDLDRFGHVATRHLSPLGYALTPTGMTNRLFFRRAAGATPTVHLHVVPASSWSTQNERILRDFLRTHPRAVGRYGDLKRRLAAGLEDPLAYTRAKTELIQELVDQARAELGLPLVAVWPE
ncbi:MAG: GrpB family protein [Nakamurella sp.]